MRRIVQETSILPVLLREKELMLRAKRIAMQNKSKVDELMDSARNPPASDNSRRNPK